MSNKIINGIEFQPTVFGNGWEVPYVGGKNMSIACFERSNGWVVSILGPDSEFRETTPSEMRHFAAVLTAACNLAEELAKK